MANAVANVAPRICQARTSHPASRNASTTQPSVSRQRLRRKTPAATRPANAAPAVERIIEGSSPSSPTSDRVSEICVIHSASISTPTDEYPPPAHCGNNNSSTPMPMPPSRAATPILRNRVDVIMAGPRASASATPPPTSPKPRNGAPIASQTGRPHCAGGTSARNITAEEAARPAPIQPSPFENSAGLSSHNTPATIRPAATRGRPPLQSPARHPEQFQPMRPGAVTPASS